MGSTITTGKAAAAFAAQGVNFYVLYERTYEKNCYPHTPHWSVVGFGSLPGICKRIASSTASTCGGMLQSTAGRIRPASYWQGWMRALAKPLAMPQSTLRRAIRLERRFVDPSEPGAMNVDEAIGHLGLVAISNETGGDLIVEIDLAQQAAQFEQLLALTKISPWRVFSPHPALSDKSARPVLGYENAQLASQRQGAADPVAISTGYERFAVAGEHMGDVMFGLTLEEGGGSVWRISDSPSTLLAKAIREAGAIEATNPGSVAATIERVEVELERHIKIPDLMNQPVRLRSNDPSTFNNDWSRAQYAKLVKFFEAQQQVRLSDVADRFHLRELGPCLTMDVDAFLNGDRPGAEWMQRQRG